MSASQPQRWRCTETVQPPAEVLIFPVNRRVGFIERNLAQAAAMPIDHAVAYLKGVVDEFHRELIEMGIDQDRASDEAHELDDLFGIYG
jgi:Family of unknown function (DUF6074)